MGYMQIFTHFFEKLPTFGSLKQYFCRKMQKKMIFYAKKFDQFKKM